MSDDRNMLLALAALCDAIKRIERAVESDDPQDRSFHLSECTELRRKAEGMLLR